MAGQVVWVDRGDRNTDQVDQVDEQNALWEDQIHVCALNRLMGGFF